MRRFLAVVAFLLPGSLWAQSVKLPAEVKGPVGAFIVVSAETDDSLVKWFSVDRSLNLFPPQLLKDSKIAVVTALVPGRYRLLAVSAKDGTPSDFAECVVVIGDAPPIPVPPTPVPPGPTPPPVPPDPTPAGSRSLFIVRETAETTPQLARLVTSLRSGPSAEYLKSKGHTLTILDDDAVGFDGKPSQLVEAWRPHFANLPLPALIIYDSKSQAILYKVSIGPTATAAEIITALKAHGG